MQDDADKGIKTRNSGESGYVGEQERPGASSHVPGQPDTKSSQTTTGTGSSARETGGRAGGVSVGEQEKKPVTRRRIPWNQLSWNDDLVGGFLV
jgi:hypothetical protein